jgi:hypothetical protein
MACDLAAQNPESKAVNQSPSTLPESLSGLIERVTFFNEENGIGRTAALPLAKVGADVAVNFQDRAADSSAWMEKRRAFAKRPRQAH